MGIIIKMVKLYSRKEASEELGIHFNTLYKIANDNEIDAIKIGGHTYYDVDKYLKEKGLTKAIKRRKICYCRVSSRKQNKDLENQKKVMKTKYPYHELISDIGSGLNNKRPGFRKIINYIMDGELDELVIGYKDRLTRFSYDLLEWMITTRSNGKIVVLNKKEEKTPHEEISEDILSIINVYVAKINGLRKYKKLIKDEIDNNK